MEDEATFQVKLNQTCPSFFGSLYELFYNYLQNRHYFSIGTNPGEQFHSFITLSAWLIQKAGGDLERPQEVSGIKMFIRSGNF